MIYPTAKDNVDYTTGFIVIGGATLSRGLTIEGLVSTYFLRTVKQADTLMQMGRWFGYRKGYELLPRIWMSKKTKEQFKFLSKLDFELRTEMKYMEDNGIKPSLIGIKVRTHPKKCFLELSSKHKLKAAKAIDIDFGGMIPQTTIFHSNEEILEENYNNAIEFFKQLMDLSKENYVLNGNSHIWKHVDNPIVLSFLKKMKYPQRNSSFLDLTLFEKWYNKIVEKELLEDWNVVFAGIDNPTNDDLIVVGDSKICKVVRSRKEDTVSDGYIRIGALRAVKELYADIDLNDPSLAMEDREKITKLDSKNFMEIRKNAGLSKTSLLIIYMIDKNSKPKEGAQKRVPMNTQNDVVGIQIVIPQSKNADEGMHLSINLDDKTNEESFEEADVDDED